MTTSHDVFVSTLEYRKRLRDAYVELRGYDCVLYLNNKGTGRRDFYGDIETTTATYLEEEKIKLVVDFSAFVRILDSFVQGTNEGLETPLKAICRLDQEINIGDRVKFDQKYWPIGVESKIFQVIDVKLQRHDKPLSKNVVLNVLRDPV